MTTEEKRLRLKQVCGGLQHNGTCEQCTFKDNSVCVGRISDMGNDQTIDMWYDLFFDEDTQPGGIKDSGERTEFATGAVRDMHEGKGRMDLLPWAAIMEVSKHCENGAKKYGEHNVDKGIPTHSLCVPTKNPISTLNESYSVQYNFVG